MSCEQIIYGTIIAGREMEPLEGYICLRDGAITEIAEERSKSNNIIAPCFVNSHTHIGDSVYKDPPLGRYHGSRLERDLDALVKPPNGLKHRILRKTAHQQLVDSMKRSIMDMLATGTSAFADFRESGTPGIQALKEAIDDTNIQNVIFGRPSNTEEPLKNIMEEIGRVLEHVDGLGMSGANDMEMEILEGAVAHVREKGRMFAIHAGEKERKDIDAALSLAPDILIHLTKANQQDLGRVADQDVPVVVCPRSNFTTGVGMAPVHEMIETGITVAVGTDNVMLNSVNMFAEMEILSKVFGIEDRQVFKMCTLNGASVLGLNNTGCIQKGNRASLMILNGDSNNLSGVTNPLSGIVRRARPDDILSIIQT